MVTVEEHYESPSLLSQMAEKSLNLFFHTPFINGLTMALPAFLALYFLITLPKNQGRRGLMYGAIAFGISQLIKSGLTISLPMLLAGKAVYSGHANANVNLELFKTLLMTLDIVLAYAAMQFVPGIRTRDLQTVIGTCDKYPIR